MPNVQHFGANTLAGFVLGGSPTEVTTGGHFDAAYTDRAMKQVAQTDTLTTPVFAAAETSLLFTRFDILRTLSIASTHDAAIWYNSSSVANFKLRSDGQFQYWNGAAWVSTGSAISIPSGLTTFVIKIDIAAGSWQCWNNGTSLGSGSGITISGGNIQSFRLGRWDNNSLQEYSQVMIANYDITNSHLIHDLLNGNSATNTGGTGAYTTVEKVGFNDATFAYVAAAGVQHGWTHAGVTVPAGYDIAASVINGRGNISGTITNGRLGIRSAGTNYPGSNLGYVSGVGPKCKITTQDPATAAAWTQAGYNASEPFIEGV
jgi:hypothetical protein